MHEKICTWLGVLQIKLSEVNYTLKWTSVASKLFFNRREVNLGLREIVALVVSETCIF